MIATEKYKQVTDFSPILKNISKQCCHWLLMLTLSTLVKWWRNGKPSQNLDPSQFRKIKIIQEPIGIIIQHSLPQNYPHPRVNRMTITSDYPQSTSGANTPSTASLCLHLNLLHSKINTNANTNTNTITNTNSNTNANTNSSGANCKHTISSLAVFTLALAAFWFPGF